MRRPGKHSALQFILNMFSGVEGRAFCRQLGVFHTKLEKVSSWTQLCANGHCHARTDLHFSSSNGEIYKYILYSCVSSVFWQQFGAKSYMGMMVRCSQAFSHIIHIKLIYFFNCYNSAIIN